MRSLHAPDGLYSWASLAELGDQLPLCAGVALEGLYLGRAGSQVIGTAETAGELLGAVLATQRAEIQRPLATQWRAAVLALPSRTSAQQADRYAKTVCESVFGASDAWKSGHAVDAACLALWAAGYRGHRHETAKRKK